MNIFKAIEKRRSIRNFKNKSVSDEKILKIIDAAIKAPSAGNMQPWEFFVIKNEKTKAKIVDSTFMGYSKSGKSQEWLNKAPILIIACIDIKRPGARYGMQGVEKYSLLDISGAIENMLLAATALDLGSCWVGGFDEEEVRDILKLDKNIKAVGIIPVGYYTNLPAPPNRLSLDDVVHFI